MPDSGPAVHFVEHRRAGHVVEHRRAAHVAAEPPPPATELAVAGALRLGSHCDILE